MRKEFTLNRITNFTEEELLRFEEASDLVSSKAKGIQGIGSYQEKSVHAVLKHYFSLEEECQEVKIGQYVADVLKDGEIFEIQSKSFYVMKDKLTAFLKEYDVTIVHPVLLEKTVRWIDPETGEVNEAKKSPRKGSIYSVLQELYSIKEFLKKKNLHVLLVFLEVEEYRLLDGYGKDRKKRATKTDKVPTKYVGEFLLDHKRDYKKFLPEETPKQFTTKDIKELSKCTTEEAGILCHLLSFLGVVKEIGKQGRYKLYEK